MKKLKSHAISGVFVFLLLGIFAVFSTVTVLFGANAYKNSITRSAEHNTRRILSTYVRSMAHSCDEAESIYTERVKGVKLSYPDPDGEPVSEDVGEVDTLVLVLSLDEEGTYIDRIYVYEGQLMERLYEISEPFEPALGNSVCAADGLNARIEDGLLSVSITSGDETADVDIALRAAR